MIRNNILFIKPLFFEFEQVLLIFKIYSFMKISKKVKKELCFEIFWLVVGILLAIFLFKNNLLFTFVFLFIFVISVIFFRIKRDITYFILGVVIGTFGEIICVHFGVWSYSNPSFLGIPMWLPLAWGFATTLIRRFAITFGRIRS